MKKTALFFIKNVAICLASIFLSFNLVNAQDLLKSKSQGNDLLKLNGTFEVPTDSDSKLASENPFSAVVADIDSDGVNDLIVGKSGSISIQRGDINAFAPKTQSAWEAIRDLQYISPFERNANTIGLPISADFVQSGDFTRDGNVDLIVASRNSTLIILLEGNGKGNFSEPREIFVGGNVSAFAVGDVNRVDGLSDVIVGIGNEVLIYQGLGDILSREPSRISLSNYVQTIAIGQLDTNSFTDIAVGNGNQISIISGNDDKNEVSDLTQNFSVKSLIIGDFVPDREFRSEIAVLDESGTIHILSRGDLDTRPVTKKEQLAEQVRNYQAKGFIVPKRILSQLTDEDLRQPISIVSADNQTWAEYDQVFGVVPNSLVSSNAVLTSGRLSNSGEDLIVLDADNNQINVMPMAIAESESGEKISYIGKRQSVKFNLENAPIVAITGRFNFDSEKDLLVLQNGKLEATTLVSAPQAAFTVNNAGDAVDANPGNGVCATAGSVCTLRAAIMEANHLAGSDSITINSGINITINNGSPDNDTNGVFNTEAGGDLDITCAINAGGDTCNAPLASNVNNLTITGAAGGNTIAVGTFTAFAPLTSTTDRVFDIGMDGIFGGGFGAGTGLQVSMSNLTIQSGNVREDFNAGGGGFGNFARGGAIRMDGFGQGGTRGSLTLTSVTINNNQADHDTGGVFNQYSSISYTTVTNTNNIGKAGPGGALQFLAGTPATLNISASAFTGNESRNGTVFGTPASDSDGGAVAANHDTNTGTIGNTNFTNNISFDDGGAVKAFNGAITISNGTMTGNTARDDGGAVWGDIDTVGAARFLTLSGVNLNNNIANSDTSGGGDGGAIFRDRGTLTVSNCIIGSVANPNRANNGGGIAHAFRAGASASNVTTINVDNGSIVGNNATRTTGSGEGGAVYLNGTNFNVGNPSTLNLGATTTVTIDENNANIHGGGISMTGGSAGNLTRATFSANDADADNNASGDGGGLYHNNASGTTTIASTVSFTNNGNGTTTTENGGAIHHSNGTLTLNTPTVSGNDADVQGGGLFVSGGTVNVNGVTFSANTFPANAAEVRLTGGTTNFSGTVTIPGELSIAGGILSAGSSTVNLNEDFHFSSGTFTAGTSTFNFNGTGTQQIYGGVSPSFNNLTDANTAQPLNVQNSANANGTLTVNAGAVLNPAATSVIGGTGTLTGSGNANVTRTAATADFSSQYTISNKVLTNLLVDYIGGAAQVVSALTYGGLRLNNASGANLATGTATVNGTLFLTNGNLGIGTSTLVVNNGITVGSGTFSSASTGTFNYNQGSDGQVVLAGNYGNLTFSNFNKVLPITTVGIAGTFTPGSAVGHTVTGSNINFNGTVAQTIPVFPYQGLTLANASGASLGGNVTVNGSLGLASGVLSVGTNTLTINSSTAQTAGSISSAATGTVNYNQGSNGQGVLTGNYGNLTFSNFNKTLPSGAIGIAGTFTPGTATGHTVTGNTASFNGTGAQTIPAFTFNNLSTATGGTKTLSGTVTALGNVTIGAASTLALGGNTLNIGGNFTNNNAFNGSLTEEQNQVLVGGNTVFNGTAAQTVSGNATTFNDLTINNSNGVTFSVNGTVNGILTLTSGNISMGANTLTLGSTGSVSRTSGHVLGKLAKTFSGVGTFTYDVGTANGYSPVNVSVTGGTGTLTINAVQGVHPNAPIPASAIARYWTLSGSGVSTNLTFNYLQSDVVGANENLFNLIKINPPIVSAVYGPRPNVIFDRVLNTVTINGVSAFSDWTLGEAIPTAASASISGRVISSAGRPISQANLILTDSSGQSLTVRTNNFGYFNFADLPSGQTYILTVNKKGYQFNEPSRTISLQENLEGVNFTALP